MLLAIQSWHAQAQSTPFPFSDSSTILERMFGEDSEEDRIALENVSVSLEEERVLGDEVVKTALASLDDAGISVETTGKDVDYLSSLVATLKPHMRHKSRYKTIRVMLAKSPKVDARSYPGGTLIFFEGLLDAVDNEAALVGIVGHELSHVDRGHQLLPIKRMKLIKKSFGSQDLTQFLSGQSTMTKLWARPFRPEDERDADRDGVAWSYAAGYDPRELAKLFQKLEKKSSQPAKGGDAPWATFFRSHPYHHERQEAVLKQFQSLRPKKSKVPLSVWRENLINRTSRLQLEKTAAEPK